MLVKLPFMAGTRPPQVNMTSSPISLKDLRLPEQKKKRSDAPGDAEHGEERAQLVGPEGAEGLAENLKKDTHGDHFILRVGPGLVSDLDTGSLGVGMAGIAKQFSIVSGQKQSPK
jgi:hypothetical protein